MDNTQNKISKVIHYCWFGGKPLPPLALKCIESWKKYFPDYEIKEWNESNYDVNSILYTKQAYAAKKYAFVSDYARIDILHRYGGIYLDTDVEIIRPLEDIIEHGPYMGFECDANSGYKNVWDSTPRITVNIGLGFAAIKGDLFLSKMKEIYKTLSFNYKKGAINTTTVVTIITNELLNEGLEIKKGIQHVAGYYIYPAEYFAPKRDAKDKKTFILTDKTRSIHHYAGSWVSKWFILKCKLTQLIENILPISGVLKLRSTYRLIVGKK